MSKSLFQSRHDKTQFTFDILINRSIPLIRSNQSDSDVCFLHVQEFMKQSMESSSEGGHDSILDNDLYKFSMQQAVLKLYPEVVVKYAFTNRAPTTHQYSKDAYHALKQRIDRLDGLAVTEEEWKWLKDNCPYLDPVYLDFLKSFKFNTKEHISIEFIANDDTRNGSKSAISIQFHGKWVDTILYEVPIMSLVSETYFKVIDKDWDYEGQYEQAYDKAVALLKAGCEFSEFGTRRRRDWCTQDIVVKALADAANANQALPGKLLGTSNVYFAKKYNLQTVGTVAHEWTMAVSGKSNLFVLLYESPTESLTFRLN